MMPGPRFVTLPEIRREAKRRLSREAWNFGAGGAETETTLKRNRRALDRLAIRQDILVDVREIDLRTTLLGVPLSAPIAVAPMGGLVLFHPEGDVEMARGAGLADTLVFLSGATGWPVEAVAAASTGPKMFQLYHMGDRAWVGDLLARVEAAGYLAVCLTVDVQVYGRRERDILARFNPREAMSKAPNPRPPDPSYPARLTWSDVDWLRKATNLPVGLKGVMTPQDARRAVEAGVELVWVSNHGGRQLDHTQATIDALPPIVDAVGGRAEIVIDGGFARGTDVLKGLARGATVVALARAALWGLAADGAAGVARALEIVRDELRTTMALSGQTCAARLEPELVFRVD
ncbi:MAG: alpha-hydroxy-acid oxidizing protein [Candidatus Rokubacteria bacterium]|nr:alpha-hydroxy-acid oxidizing protein [Candidatus Rokubacteria bacterium]